MVTGLVLEMIQHDMLYQKTSLTLWPFLKRVSEVCRWRVDVSQHLATARIMTLDRRFRFSSVNGPGP